MCDQHFEEDLTKYMRHPAMSRRQFGALSVGVGMAMLLPRAADALDVKESDVNVTTPDASPIATSCTRPAALTRAC